LAIEKLIPLKLPPGLYRNGTTYQSQGRWYDAQLVRFFESTIRPVGGWALAQTGAYSSWTLGTGGARPLAILSWRTNDGILQTMAASGQDLELFSQGTVYTVTPTGYPPATLTWTGSLVLGAQATAGATSITLSATTVGGQIYRGDVFHVTGGVGQTFTVSAPVTPSGTSVVVAIAGTVTNTLSNGDAVTWYPSAKIDSASSAAGYGTGPYGNGGYGVGVAGGTFTDSCVWTMDNFGSYWVGTNTQTGYLYAWLGVTANPAIILPGFSLPTLTYTGAIVTSGSTTGGASSISLTATTLTGTVNIGDNFGLAGTQYTITAMATASGNVVACAVSPNVPTTIAASTPIVVAPVNCRAVVCTSERFLFALGANGDYRQVAWADQQSFSTWVPASTNQAGSFEIPTAGRIMSGMRSKYETLIFTDADLWRAVYIGYPLVYSFSQCGNQCGIIAPNAFAAADTVTYWMGVGAFYMYNGTVQALQCDIADYVFSNINLTQRAKIWAQAIPQFGEVWFFYPSAASPDPDSYVIYNYRENHWSFGMLPWTAGNRDNSITQNPYVGAVDGSIYQRDLLNTTHVSFYNTTTNLFQPGNTAGQTTLVPYVESGPTEIGTGDKVWKLQRMIPDEKTLGQTQLYLWSSFYPTDVATEYGPFNPADQTFLRITGRQVRARLSQVTDGIDWRVGLPRFGAVQGGSR
jgi:hypothetical protein